MRRTIRRTAKGDWSSEVSSGFALAGFLAVVFVGFTLLAMGPLVRIDAYFNLAPPPRAWVPVLHVIDRIGQRAVALPILFVVLYFVVRRQQSWRPVVVAGAAVFFLNLLVLVLKVGLGRGQPGTANPSFFVGGMAYPSGHSSNVILVYGVIVYLLHRYGALDRARVVLGSGLVGLLCVVMVVTSLTLDWHWFADLIAGLLVGGMMLQLTATLDLVLKDYAPNWPWLTRLVRRIPMPKPRE